MHLCLLNRYRIRLSDLPLGIALGGLLVVLGGVALVPAIRTVRRMENQERSVSKWKTVRKREKEEKEEMVEMGIAWYPYLTHCRRNSSNRYIWMGNDKRNRTTSQVCGQALRA